MERERIGKYEVIGKLGEGSFGVVFHGRDPSLKREVAIKVCSVEDAGLRKRFMREGEISARLQHKNIVTVYAAENDDDGVPFLVQEYLPGEDLDAMVHRREALPPQDKIAFLLQVAQGLSHAHAQGIIHRDIKPANIRRLEGGLIKIMDFGIAKLASAETQLTQKGVTMGTASYLPPEQVRGGDLDHRADIFSFGVLAYELLTYERPFRGNTLSALVYQILYKVPLPMNALWADCPEALSELVSRCLEKKPERRFASFDELIPQLSGLAKDIAQGHWPSLREVSTIAPPPPPEDDDVPMLSESQIARTASHLESGLGEATVARGSAASIAATEPTTDADPEATQAIGSLAVPPGALPDAAQAGAPTALANAPTQILRTPALSQTAEQVSALIAQGDLEAAKRKLEESMVDTPPARSGATKSDSAGQASKPVNNAKLTGSASDLLAEIAAERHAEAKPPPPPPPPPSSQATEVATEPVIKHRAEVKKTSDESGSFMAVLFELPIWQRWAALAAALILLIGIGSVMVGRGGSETEPVVAPKPTPTVQTPVPEVAEPMGRVRVSAVPWGEVSEIIDAEGYVKDLPSDPWTPLLLELPPGSYTVHLRRPDASDVMTCEVVVTLEEIVPCEVLFGEASTTDFFKETGWWQ